MQLPYPFMHNIKIETVMNVYKAFQLSDKYEIDVLIRLVFILNF